MGQEVMASLYSEPRRWWQGKGPLAARRRQVQSASCMVAFVVAFETGAQGLSPAATGRKSRGELHSVHALFPRGRAGAETLGANTPCSHPKLMRPCVAERQDTSLHGP